MFSLCSFRVKCFVNSSEVLCKKLKVSQTSIQREPIIPKYSFRGGRIALEDVPVDKEPFKTEYVEDLSYVCFPKDSSLNILSKITMYYTSEVLFSVSIDNKRFETTNYYEKEVSFGTNSKICLHYGWYSPLFSNKVNHVNKSYFYLNFVSEELAIKPTDLLFLHVYYAGNYHSVSLKKLAESKTEIKSKFPGFYEHEVKTDSCNFDDRQNDLEFKLNDLKFSMKINSVLRMSFINSFYLATKNISSECLLPSFLCSKNSLHITYDRMDINPKNQNFDSKSETKPPQKNQFIV